MASSTVEDYVKAVYALQRESPTGEATVVRLAAVLGVTKGTVTTMVRKLCEAGLADAERYGGIRLTERGARLALDVVRRHRLIEVFLVEVLKFDWSEVHDEAERLEHAVSAKFLDRLDAHLGHPAIDPHGDPIPDAQGRVVERAGVPLSEFVTGERGEIVRVSDADPAFLALMAKHGLRPGAGFVVAGRVPEAGTMSVRAASGERGGSAEGGAEVSLSIASAGRVVAVRRPGGGAGAWPGAGFGAAGPG